MAKRKWAAVIPGWADMTYAQRLHAQRTYQLNKSRQAPDKPPTKAPRGSRSVHQRSEAAVQAQYGTCPPCTPGMGGTTDLLKREVMKLPIPPMPGWMSESQWRNQVYDKAAGYADQFTGVAAAIALALVRQAADMGCPPCPVSGMGAQDAGAPPFGSVLEKYGYWHKATTKDGVDWYQHRTLGFATVHPDGVARRYAPYNDRLLGEHETPSDLDAALAMAAGAGG